MTEDSIFTKIIKGEIPSHKIYEDDKTYAFLDIHPIQPGHVLVVPKIQVDNIWDLPDEDYHALMDVTKHIAFAMQQKLEKEWVFKSLALMCHMPMFIWCHLQM